MTRAALRGLADEDEEVLVAPAAIRPSVPADSDDDAVLACALGAGLIVPGDANLLNLRDFHGIPIVTATGALGRTIG